MPTISMFRGIKVFINWRDHMPPHFHAAYGGQEVIVSIEELEVLDGSLPGKQLKMLLARIGSWLWQSKSFLPLSR